MIRVDLGTSWLVTRENCCIGNDGSAKNITESGENDHVFTNWLLPQCGALGRASSLICLGPKQYIPVDFADSNIKFMVLIANV